MSETPTTGQLLLYTFGPEAEFEGHLVQALEQIEIGGAIGILEILFVRRDPDTGELVTLVQSGDRMGSLAAPLLAFRLGSSRRGGPTAEALRRGGAGLSASTVRTLGERLGPGEAVVAVVVDHVWARTLARAVARTGGTPLASEVVDAGGIGELVAERLPTLPDPGDPARPSAS